MTRRGVVSGPTVPPTLMSPIVLVPRTPCVSPSAYVSVRLVLAETRMSGLSGTDTTLCCSTTFPAERVHSCCAWASLRSSASTLSVTSFTPYTSPR